MEPLMATERPRATEPSLVERARGGDTAAFEALLGDRLDPLFRTAWAILGSEADARDATQETCISEGDTALGILPDGYQGGIWHIQ